jgi:transposase
MYAGRSQLRYDLSTQKLLCCSDDVILTHQRLTDKDRVRTSIDNCHNIRICEDARFGHSSDSLSKVA